MNQLETTMKLKNHQIIRINWLIACVIMLFSIAVHADGPNSANFYPKTVGGGSGNAGSSDDVAPCGCQGGVVKMTFLYSGPNGVNLEVYRKSNLTELITTFSGVNSGDILMADASGVFNGKFHNRTYFRLVQAGQQLSLTSVPSNCGQNPVGKNYGDLSILTRTDKINGETCTICDLGLGWKLGGNNALPDCNTLGTLNNEDLRIITDGTDRMCVTKDGKVGIGTLVPGEDLEVVGKSKTSDLQVTNGAATGFVLISDAQGNASWQSNGWGAQAVQTDASLEGDGTSGDLLKIAQQGAISGQVLKWDGNSWLPGTDDNADADPDPNNEIQHLFSSSFGTDRMIDITNGGGTIIDVADNDNDSGNELITDFLLTGTTLEIEDAGAFRSVSLSSLEESAAIAAVANDLLAHVSSDNDLDATNEIQSLSIAGSTISLNNGGGSVTLPSSADNLGNHITTSNLQVSTPFELRFGLPGELSDPIYFRRINEGGVTSDLRLFIHDNPEERFSIWGNSCAAGGCSEDAQAQESFRFEADGDAFKPGGGAWANISDRRLKTDIRSFDYGLEALKKVETVTYRYNGKARINSEKEFVGVIAQDLKKIAPFMVKEIPVPMTIDKNEKEKYEDYLSVDPSAFTYMLINSIQEQQEMIEHQQQMIDQLQEDFTELKELITQLSSSISEIEEHTVPSSPEMEDGTSLDQNRPNPFTETTTINYKLGQDGKVSVKVYSISGSLVATLVDTEQPAGQYEVQWQPSGLSSGVYVYKLIMDDKEIARKMILLK